MPPATKKRSYIPPALPSGNAKAALEKAVDRFGKQVKIVNDNGSENMKEAENYLASLGATQYWTRPKAPKEKPFVERLIGTLERWGTDRSR